MTDRATRDQRAFLADLRGYLLACIGDEDGRLAVERNRALTLTAGQVQALAEALALLDVEISANSGGRH